MKIFNKLAVALLLIVALVVAVPQGYAQTAIPNTALTNAVGVGATRLVVTSTTGIVASTQTLDQVIYLDKEAYRITAVNSSTSLTVSPGYGPSLSTGHAAGTTAYFGPVGGAAALYQSAFTLTTLGGSCTRSPGAILPIINVRTGVFYDCQGGVWIEEQASQQVAFPPVPTKVCSIPIGGVAYASLGTSTATVAGTIYQTSIFVPRTFLATGVRILEGTVAGTDAIIGALFNMDGKLLANSALAGATVSGSNTFQTLAFTTPRLVTGPAFYVIGAQSNGTTDAFKLVAASTYVDINAKSQTGTFGTLPTIVPATTFTATTAPVACLY